MIEIKEVWLYTNRVVVVFDQDGEQIGELQAILSDKFMYGNELETALAKVIKARPKFYVASWQNWIHKIRADEFCCLLGKGDWYFKNKEIIFGENIFGEEDASD